MSDTAAVEFLVLRVKELEAEVARLTEKVRYNAEKQKAYRRRSVKTAAKCSNEEVTEAVTMQSRSGNDAVTPLPSSLPHTPSLLRTKSKNNKYSSPLADFLAENWPDKPLTEAQEKAWREAAPGVDLLAEAKTARAWQLEDLQRRQRPRFMAFLGNWFRNAQQRMRATAPAARGATLQISPRLEQETTGRKVV